MRTATLAALALASACGSSSPEVAPPPAPAPAPAAAVPRASIVATEQYYDIDGASTGALRDQINRLGPKDESGKSRDALTVWSIEWGYAATSRPDGCVLRLAALVLGSESVDLIPQRAGARSVDVVVLLGGRDRRPRHGGRGSRCRRGRGLPRRGAARGGGGQRCERCRAHVRATPA